MSDAMRCAPDEGAIVFHLDGGPRRLSVDELRGMAAACAAVLADRGLGRGDLIGILGPNRPEWAAWAHGAWAAGAGVVPLPAPVRVRDPEAFRAQIRSLVDAISCRVVVAHPRFIPSVPDGLAIAWDAQASPAADSVSPDGAEPDDVALVMCTSGSTAMPKGIPLTQAKVVERHTSGLIRQLMREMQPRWLSWMPFYHAAGLMPVLQPVFDGVEHHVLPTERFARDPGEWLRLVGPTGATLTSAASSGWAAALRAITRRPGGVDLSSLVSAFFGMEMVDPDVVDRLLEVGVPLGLRPEAVSAGYGLSEGGGTMTPPNAGIRIDSIDLDELVSTGRAVPATGSRPAKRVASCGVPGDELELRIAGAEGPLPDRHVGEVQFRGPGLMESYLGRDASETFEQGWLRTGDLGYLAEGELFVTGRSKELIVHLGRNYHPEDIEWAASRVAGVVPGGCVAFAPADGAEGDAVVAVEAAHGADGADLRDRVRAAVTNAVGLAPRDVLIVAPDTIPRAPNGKLQRLAARDAYGRGELVDAQ